MKIIGRLTKYRIGYFEVQSDNLISILIKGVYEKNNRDIFYCSIISG